MTCLSLPKTFMTITDNKRWTCAHFGHYRSAEGGKTGCCLLFGKRLGAAGVESEKAVVWD